MVKQANAFSVMRQMFAPLVKLALSFQKPFYQHDFISLSLFPTAT